MELMAAPKTEVAGTGFTQTEWGALPNDWHLKPLASISSFITKGSTPTTYGFRWESDGVLFLRSECVSEAGLDLAQSMFISPMAHNLLSRSEVKSGDLLITITGNVGRVVHLDESFGNANINQHIARVRITGQHVDSRFIYHWLSQPRIRLYYNTITTGQAYPQISLAQVRETLVPLPPLPEQRAIATALSDVDGLLAGLDALIAKKKALKQGAMQQLLTGKQRLPGFKGEWVVKRLGDVARIEMGRTPSRLNSAYWGQGHPWVSIGDMHDKVIHSTKEEITDAAAREMYAIPKGTLIMSFKLSIGRLAFTGRDMYSNEAICSFNDLDANAQFLYYVLSRTDFSLYGKQAVKGFTLNKESLKSVDVALPGRKEQTAIAEVLSDMDAELDALEARRAKTALLKQGMMQELLTGRVRLI